MLSKRDNFLETIRGGKPNRLVKQYEAISMLPGDHVCSYQCILKVAFLQK